MKKKQIASAKARGVKEAIITKVRQRRIVKKQSEKNNMQKSQQPENYQLETFMISLFPKVSSLGSSKNLVRVLIFSAGLFWLNCAREPASIRKGPEIILETRL